MPKINFFHNFELFKKHLNFVGSAEQPKRLDIVKLAKEKAKNSNLITSYEIEDSKFNDEYKEYLNKIHPAKHIQEIANSEKNITSLYPLQAFTQTFATAIKDSQISFFAMRPPGHHSFAGGISKDDDFDGGYQVGEGFCYFNNVVFATLLANIKHHKKSVLIVDWDYHHGNGTQATLFDIKNDSITTKFKDFDTYFISLHNATIYPYKEDPDKEPNNYATISGKANNSNSYVKNIHTSKKDYIDEIFLPKFYNAIDEAFVKMTPDLIFISAGFDARNGDPIAKFVDGEGLSDEAYYKMANYIKNKQQTYNKIAPIVSLLEGGYNVTESGFSEAVYQHLKGLHEGQL
ncbi:hypothetical protein QIW49_05715 [Francisellaceae bacterium CB300]